ncbi:MAG TPA: SpoIIE family protein phosphatase [Actinospica sp.]|nr:SpoIIE family protein phosphatase [Actinospica sp.]
MVPRPERPPALRMRRARRFRLWQRILVAELAILAVTSVIGFTLFAITQRGQLDRYFEQRAVSIAQVAAQNPEIRAAMAAGRPPSPDSVVQAVAQRIAAESGASYVVVIDLQRIRHSHPIPALIGQPVAEPIVVRDGQPHIRVDAGATGRSANARVPLYAPGTGNRLVGEVSAGIPETEVTSQFGHELAAFGIYAGIAVGIGALASLLLARRLKRTTFGLELDEIAGLLHDREATLYGIREGVIGSDANGCITVINSEARRLLRLPGDGLEGHQLSQIGLDPEVTEVLAPGQTVTDEVVTVGDRLLVVNSWPTGRDGGAPGSVATLRDSTELRLLSAKAETVRRRLKLLYDAGGAVGTTLDPARTAQELAGFGVPHFADFVAVDLVEGVLAGEEPAPTELDAVRVRRVAVDGFHTDDSFIPVGEIYLLDPGTPQARAFLQEKALLEPDLETEHAWRAQAPERSKVIFALGFRSRITVPVRARGVLLGMAFFWRLGNRAPFDEEELTVAEGLVARAALSIDNGRRYTREHAMAVTLQRSLLPHGTLEHSAVDLAFRYLPAESVGGDWFDAIALPGARVALVVGDVVGHGLLAAATMGRLRTAVHNLSALDLSPDELLWHLDDLVARIDQEQAEDEDPAEVIGASCLYAIYDPGTRICAIARAAHPPPALVAPDGSVSFPDVPAGPPLGLGGLPFETVEIELPEGSQLVLYTDGLIEDRGRDINESLELLRAALGGGGGRTPEQTCETVLAALLPPRPTDDIALLVARTHALAPDQSDSWEVPSDPAAVAEVRARAGRRLEEWGLEDAVFTTELILSELVTNAIRHATGPIHVRLLRDRMLICEVTDASSTSPHLRHAASTDEGGRGLFLVAQLADRWGTRYLPTGKVIWAEQTLTDASHASWPDAAL